MKTAMKCVGAALALTVLVSCQTTKTKSKAGTSGMAEFQPGAYLVPIRHETGKYANLFSPESFALWVGPEVMQFKEEMAKKSGATIDPKMDADAREIAKDFLVLECHIESAFSDSSIAYDVVGFRGLDDVYLSLPDGQKIYPEQTIIGARLDQESKGTLKVFRRTNLLVFPRRDLWTGGPTLNSRAASVRLVLDGYSSRFYFEWPAAPGTVTRPKWSPAAADAKRAVMMGYTELVSRLRRLAHLFD